MNELREITVERTAALHGEYPRFRLMARIEHMVLLITFTILCLTGLPQKFPFSPISTGLIDLLGGIETVRYIHRWAAVILVLGSVYHLLTSSYRLFVRRERMRMLPDIKDAYDLRDTVTYNLGLQDNPPRMRKFNFGEKFEYWAVVWGTAVMIITGFILWNPISATRLIPGNWIPVALEAHGWEAVLAAASIVIWHLYNVLIKHRNKSMFTGTLSHTIMEEEHLLELERLERGGEAWPAVPPLLCRRLGGCCSVVGPGGVDVHVRKHGHHHPAGGHARCVCPTGHPRALGREQAGVLSSRMRRRLSNEALPHHNVLHLG